MLYKQCRILCSLTANDFKARYSSSVLGTLWLLINPILTVLVFWFVFRVGFRVGAPRPNLTFVVWFSSGFVPWLCFAESLGGASGSVLQYSYLLRKQAFPIDIIPAIKIATAFLAHVIFVLIIFALMLVTDTPFSESILHLPYYMACLLLLSLGVGYISAAITPFFRDWAQVVGIILQFGAWLTPVMWPWIMLPEAYRWTLHINPMTYIVEGYRTSLFGGTVLADPADPSTMLPPLLWVSFWGITALLLWCGWVMYSRLRAHFSDIL